MLAAGLETCGLELEIAPGHASHRHTDHGTHGAALVDLLTNQGRAVPTRDSETFDSEVAWELGRLRSAGIERVNRGGLDEA